jgi:hypothetical protein
MRGAYLLGPSIHDDFRGYSTNEPVMSATADSIYLAAAMQASR